MREQAQAKSAGRELTYAILPGLLLSAQWLRISLISNQPSPPQISHSHTKYYNSSAIPGPAPASVPPKYQYLREQTPSCQSIIASHGTAAEGLEKKGGRGVQQVDGWAEPLWRTEQTQAEWRKSHRSQFLDQLQTTCVASISDGVCWRLLLIHTCYATFNLLYLWSY